MMMDLLQVGITGLTTGGGKGFYSSGRGYLSDNVIAAKAIVYNTSLEEFVEINATKYNKYSDFLWAIRGGMGGNYGYITEWTFNIFHVNR